MIGIVLIVVIALALCAYVAIPLLFPSQADPLPSLRDPVTQDLEDERDALFRAIRELEARPDLSDDRRQQLRARYEAKAARVLRALDERQAALAGKAPPQAKPRTARRLPAAALVLLGLMVLSGSLLGGYVLPRVGQDGTVTAAGSALEAARALDALQRAAERDPNSQNLLALANAYWQQGDSGRAKATYLRITKEVAPVPALAYRRLGLLALQDDLKQAQAYLEQAREVEPQNLDTLYALGEVYFANGHVQKAVDAWESFLKAPGGAGDETVQARLEVAREVAPLAKAAQHDPSEANLLAYADALWQREERQQAVSVYFRVLTQQDPNQPVALSRIGQLLFFGGRTDDAIAVLERAREADGQNLDTLLFLGNAYFSKNRYQDAIDAWQDYVMAAGGPEKAGRVPALIDNARARLAGGAPAPAPEAASGQALFAQNCASCHGPAGQGGAGPRLAGNPRLADDSYVRQTIRNGRGMMPAFGGRLSETQLSSLIGYLQQAFAPSEAAQGQ